MGMDLRGTILLNKGRFAPNFWKMIKMQLKTTGEKRSN